MFLARPEHTLCIWCVCGCSGVCPAEGPFFFADMLEGLRIFKHIKYQRTTASDLNFAHISPDHFLRQTDAFAQLNLHHLSWQRPVNGVPGGGNGFESLSREYTPSNLRKDQLASGELRLSAYQKTEPSVIHWILQAIKKGTESSTNQSVKIMR